MTAAVTGLHTAARRLLEDWRPPSEEQERLRQDYLAQLAAFPDACLKTGPPAHLTASCFVLDQQVESVLLTLHRKGRFWVQFGGHCEPEDADLQAAAVREAREESGLTRLEPLSALPGGRRLPVDLDRHRLPAAFGRCTEHLDVAFAALAPRTAVPVPTVESLEVAWWPLERLPDGVVPDLPGRLRRVAALARGDAARVVPGGDQRTTSAGSASSS